MYKLTLHAEQQIARRNLDAAALAAALAGRQIAQPDGTVLFYDRRTRTLLIVNPQRQCVITAYSMTRRDVKRRFGRCERDMYWRG